MQLKKLPNGQFQGVNDGIVYTVKGNQVINTKTGKPLTGADLATFKQASANPGTVIKGDGTGGYGINGGTVNSKIKGAVDPGVKGAGNSYAAADSYVNGLIGQLQPLDLSGAPKVLSADDLAGQRGSVYQSLYGTSSQNDAEQKAKDLASTQQNLAERGIPFDAASDPTNPNNLYGNTIKDINTQYDQKDQQEKNAANAGADSSLSTYVNVNLAAHSAFTSDAEAKVGSQLDQLSGAGSILNTLMQKYGIDAQTAQGILSSNTSKYIANQNNKTSGGGSSSSGGSFTGTPTTGGSVT